MFGFIIRIINGLLMNLLLMEIQYKYFERIIIFKYIILNYYLYNNN